VQICIYTYRFIYIYMYTYMYIHIHIYVYIHTYMYIYIYKSIIIYIKGYKNVYVCIYIHMYMYLYIFKHMGWLQLVGSLKLQVSLAEYCLFNRALLQKRPIILRSLLIVATPYYISYGVTSISGLLKIIGLFCNRAL